MNIRSLSLQRGWNDFGLGTCMKESTFTEPPSRTKLPTQAQKALPATTLSLPPLAAHSIILKKGNIRHTAGIFLRARTDQGIEEAKAPSARFTKV